MTRSKTKTISERLIAEEAAAIAAYIRIRGVTRCPTACAIRTQATISAADRAALARYGLMRERTRQQRMAVAAQAYGNFKVAVPQESHVNED